MDDETISAEAEEPVKMVRPKRCKGCKEVQPASIFVRTPSHHLRCPRCAEEAEREYYNPTCIICEDQYPRIDFITKNRKGKICKVCRSLTLDPPKREPMHTPALVEHEPGSPGWKRLEAARAERNAETFARLRANREEVLSQ